MTGTNEKATTAAVALILVLAWLAGKNYGKGKK